MYDYEDKNYTDPDNQIFDKIYEDLVAQGYQAYCSIPDLQYIARDNTNNTMLEDIMGIVSDADGPAESSPGNRVFVELDDYKQFFNYIDAQTPIWRKKGVYVLKDKDSLENFWSHKNKDETIGISPIDFSPAFTITSPEQQCIEKKKIIAAVDKKCKTLQNKDTCALDISYDPDSLSFWEMYKRVESNGFECSSMNISNDDLTDEEKTIKQSFLEMPFVIPTAYRYAFAIYSAELKEPRITSEFKSIWENTTHKPGFDFLRFSDWKGRELDEPNAKPRSEVRIIAFLVPDFATNQDDLDFDYTPPPEINYPNQSSTFGTTRKHEPTYPAPFYDWHDSLKVARSAIQTLETQDKYDEIWRAKKAGITITDPMNTDPSSPPLVPFEYSGTRDGIPYDFNPDDEQKKLIECLYFDGQATQAEYSCVEPFKKALTTFVNRRIENPEDCHKDVVDWEENSVIYNDAGIQRSDAGLFHLYQGSAVNMLDNGLLPNGIANVIPSTSDSSNEPIEDPNKQVFEFRFLSHYAFSSFYDGLDPIYRDAEPEKSQENKAVIHGYLVYPVGYELEGTEETILQTFLDQEAITKFEEEFEEDDRDIWFKMKGIVQSFTGKTSEFPTKFMIKTEEQCQGDYNRYLSGTSDDPVRSYGEFKDDSCKQNPEAYIESEPQINKEPRILGARFGLITIKLQQTLRSINTDSWKYVTSCLESETPTEDFLTGKCTGETKNDGRLVQDESNPDIDYMNKQIAGKVNLAGEPVDCSTVPRVDSSVGGYALPVSDVSCTIEDSLSGNSDNAVEYIESIHGIGGKWLDSNDRVNCNDAFLSFVGCYFNEDVDGWRPSLIAHKVDSQGKFTEDGTQTACEYVQDRAAEQGVSPRLALTIWLEESGAGAFVTENAGSDFGIVSKENSRQTGSIDLQLRFFLGTINSNRNIGYPRFLLQFSGEYLYGTDPDKTWRDWTSGDPVLFCRNRDFAGRLKNIYEQIGF
ncbi:MAG: hypothetical protein GW941_01775 [Candidatus Pacebacteria bacterium]|nr:hypothetical protein [Candidatus Paceibacterota bacterium]